MFFLVSTLPVDLHQDDHKGLCSTGSVETSVIGCGQERDVGRSGFLEGLDGAAGEGAR
jgi:hypothetical protein